MMRAVFAVPLPRLVATAQAQSPAAGDFECPLLERRSGEAMIRAMPTVNAGLMLREMCRLMANEDGNVLDGSASYKLAVAVRQHWSATTHDRETHAFIRSVMKDRNYTVRLYRPRAEILNGRWKFPEPQPVQ